MKFTFSKGWVRYAQSKVYLLEWREQLKKKIYVAYFSDNLEGSQIQKKLTKWPGEWQCWRIFTISTEVPLRSQCVGIYFWMPQLRQRKWTKGILTVLLLVPFCNFCRTFFAIIGMYSQLRVVMHGLPPMLSFQLIQMATFETRDTNKKPPNCFAQSPSISTSNHLKFYGELET